MKKIALKLLTLIAFVIAFSSCSDDDKKDPAGKFTVDGESFNLANGYATYDGVFSAGDDDYHYWIIVLASDGLTFEDDDFEPTGTGDAVILEIAALNDDSFVPAGSYSLDDDTGYCYAVVVDYNFGAGTGTAYEEPENLTITISKSGNTFTINFNMTMEDETVITGSYKGSLIEIDD